MRNLVRRVVETLKKGGIVALPTETVYGLVSYYEIKDSWKKILDLKSREENKPLALFIKSSKEMERFSPISPLARELAEKFWPGPLTIVLRKKERVDFPWETVGFRIPNHPFAQEILSYISPLWSTSANLTGRRSACTPWEVRGYFDKRVDVIIEEGNEILTGVPSTVVEIIGERMEILREGGIKIEEMKKKLKIGKIFEGKE